MQNLSHERLIDWGEGRNCSLQVLSWGRLLGVRQSLTLGIHGNLFTVDELEFHRFHIEEGEFLRLHSLQKLVIALILRRNMAC